MDLSISLEDLYKGAKEEVPLHRNELCKHCRGTGK